MPVPRMLRHGHTELTEVSDTAMNVLHNSQVRIIWPAIKPRVCNIECFDSSDILVLILLFFQVRFMYPYIWELFTVYVCSLYVLNFFRGFVCRLQLLFFWIFCHTYSCLVYIGSPLYWISGERTICGVGGILRAFPRGLTRNKAFCLVKSACVCSTATRAMKCI